LQRWRVQLDSEVDSSSTEEPLLLAMTMQKRVLEMAQHLSLQLLPSPITTDPPPPISLSGEPEHLPHLPPPPAFPRLYSINAADIQVACDTQYVL
jgi:hypothetical protein